MTKSSNSRAKIEVGKRLVGTESGRRQKTARILREIDVSLVTFDRFMNADSVYKSNSV